MYIYFLEQKLEQSNRLSLDPDPAGQKSPDPDSHRR